MLFSTELVLAACVGVAMAGPHHLHRHRDVHAKKDLTSDEFSALDWDNMGIDWAAAWSAGQTTATTAVAAATSVAEVKATSSAVVAVAKPKKVAATSSSAPAVVASKTSSSSAAAAKTSDANIIEDIVTLFSNIEGLANKMKAFGKATAASGSVISKIGNIGSPQGSNMIMVDDISSYDYTMTFENTSKKPMTIVLWNKAFSTDGSAETAEANLGSCVALITPALSITLSAGGKQAVAFQEDTQMGWAQATSERTASGAPATTWGEANFVSTGCGYDVSSIVNPKGNTYDMAISSVETKCISDMTQNNWIAENGNPETPIPVGTSDGSCYIPGGKATITTKMGGDVA